MELLDDSDKSLSKERKETLCGTIWYYSVELFLEQKHW